MSRVASSAARVSLTPVQTIAITGGKGGVGKSIVASSLAAALGAAGNRVLLVDGDLQLGNLHQLMKLQGQFDLSHVFGGECSLSDAFRAGPPGVTVLPSASGAMNMAHLSKTEHAGLIGLFSQLPDDVDTMIIDCASGLPDSALSFARAVREVMVVVTDDPTALQDTISTIRVLHEHCQVTRFRVVANQTDSSRHGLDLYAALTRYTDRHLDVLLDFCGSIPHDPRMKEAVARQCTVLEAFPRSPAALAFGKLATRVMRWPRPESPSGNTEFFVERLIQAAACTPVRLSV